MADSRNVAVLPVDAAVAEGAARLRARYGLRTPDAVHLATALETRCTDVLTNDPDWRRVTEVPVIVLDDL